MADRKRTPKGVPTGGEFAANEHDEAPPFAREGENAEQTRIREALQPIAEWYPTATTVYLSANTGDPYGDDESHYDDGETIYGYVRIDSIADRTGLIIWDCNRDRRDPRLERIEDTFFETKKLSDIPIDSSMSSGRGDHNGIDLYRP